MKRHLLIAALLVFSFSLFSEELKSPIFDYKSPTNKELCETPCTTEMYPDANTVIMFLHDGTQYQKDGSYISLSDECYKILTEPGRRESLVATIEYTSSYGTSYFSRVTIIKPDGKEIPIDVSKAETMIDPGQMNSNIYNPAHKVVSLNIPGLEVGDIYRVQSISIGHKARMKDNWTGGFIAEFMSPLLHETVEVYAPEDAPLGYITKRFEIPGTVTESKENVDGLIHYKWEVKDVPQIFPEPAMTPFYMSCQRYYFGVVKTWEEISKWYFNLCEPRIAVTTPEMEQKVKELIEGKKTVLEKAEAIHRWVAKEVRYMGLTTEEVAPGYEPHDVKITFENRYGVCRDKAALLCAMHRMAGLEAYPVLISVGPRKEESAPNPWFNHAINCVVDEKGEYILMDSTPEHDKHFIPAYESNCSYLIAKPEGDTLRATPHEPVEDNLAVETLKGKFDKDGNLTGEIEITFNGCNDTMNRGRYLRLRDEEKKKSVEAIVSAVFGASEVFDYEILPKDLHNMEEPFKMKIQFRANGLLSFQDGVCVLKPNYSVASVCSACPILMGSLNTSLDKRRFPMNISYVCGFDYQSEIDVSALEFKEIETPSFPACDTPDIFYSQNLIFTNGTLYSNLRQEIRKDEIPAEGYQALKDFRKEYQSATLKRVFAKAEADAQYKDAHTLLLDRETVYEILDESTVRIKNIVTKKILDYTGKKQNSELKISYCEKNSSLSLTNIYVTMEDGTVRHTVPSEINVMDAAWKAGAPRYPDIKQTIVSLPGTEIGSTVHYEYETETKDLPLISGFIDFSHIDPILHRKYTVIVPRSLKLQYVKTTPETPDPVLHTLNNDSISYVWEVNNLTNVVKEENYQPPAWTHKPQVAFTVGSWKDYAAKLQAVLQEVTKPTPEIIAKAKELTAGRETLRQKIIAVRDYVEINVRRDGPSFTALPLSEITPAAVTMQEAYGHGMDKAVLYAALLKALDLEPEIVLAGSFDEFNLTANPSYIVPQRGTFGSAYVRICLDGQTIYLNGGSQYDKLETVGPDEMYVLNLANAEIAKVEFPEEFRHNGAAYYEIEVAEDGSATVSRKVTFDGRGYGSLVADVCEKLPEMVRRQELAAADGIAKDAVIIEGFKRDTNSYPASTSIKVKTAKYVQKDGDLIYLRPFFGFSYGSAAKSTRATKYYNSSREKSYATFKIKFPEGFTEAVFLPNLSCELPGGLGKVGCLISHEEGTSEWTLSYSVELEPAVIDQEQYHKLHEIVKKFSGLGFTTVAVKKPAKKD